VHLQTVAERSVQEWKKKQVSTESHKKKKGESPVHWRVSVLNYERKKKHQLRLKSRGGKTMKTKGGQKKNRDKFFQELRKALKGGKTRKPREKLSKGDDYRGMCTNVGEKGEQQPYEQEERRFK